MSHPRPVVSVIVPTHNRVGMIGETLQSILNQTFENFELIVVDNGSTDGTEEFVARFEDPRIRYHWQEDSGLPANSRNVGIGMARGRFVAFLDSDDLWLPEKLELQVRCFEEHPEAGLVYGDAVYMGQTDKEGKSLIRRMVGGNVFADLLVLNRIPTLTAMVRQECLDEVGTFSENPGLRGAEDYHLWLRLAYRYPIYPVRRVVARYRVHESNLIGHAAGFDAVFEVLDRIGGELEVDSTLLKKAYSIHYAELAWSQYKAGNETEYQAAYRKAMEHHFYYPLALFRLADVAFGPRITGWMMQRAGFS